MLKSVSFANPASSIKSNSTTGILQITGPAAGTTRVMTVPDANFTVARTDAAQSFSGDQTLSTGNLIIGTAGKGIDFSADPHAAGMTSELFDDYEEGTWTPIIQGSTSAGTGTYSSQNGYYTKVGRQVTCNFWINWTNHTGTGNLQIAGFPFANANVSNNYANGVFGETANLTITASYVLGGFYINPNQSFAYAFQYPVGGNVIAQLPIDTSAYVMGTITYFA